MKIFESAADRDQTLMSLVITVLIAGILYVFKDELKGTIEHVLMLLLGSFGTCVTFYFKGKQENGDTPTDSKTDQRIEKIEKYLSGSDGG